VTFNTLYILFGSSARSGISKVFIVQLNNIFITTEFIVNKFQV